jgi:hypothetical protein
MSLLFMDGFDHWSDNQYREKWFAKSLGFSTSTNYKRWDSGKGAYVTSSNYVYRKLGSNEGTLVVGCAVNTRSTSYGSFLKLRDDGTTQVHIDFDNTNDRIDVYRGDSTELLGSTTGFSIEDSHYLKWGYYEIKVVISDTVGSVEIRFNESQILNLTSKDTQATTNTYCNEVYFGPSNSYIDDLYVDNSDFLGECRVRTFVPDSVSSTINDFTASAGNKDECVDDIPPNNDTDYIYGGTINDRQGFGITTGALSTVLGIQVNNVVKKDDVGVVKIKNLVRSNSSNYLDTNEYEISSDYTINYSIWETDPDDSNPWTQTKLEAAEFGLEITTIP